MVRALAPSGPAAENLAALPSAQREYLTREQFAAVHGADPQEVLAVQRFAVDAGLLVLSADLARRSVVLQGTVEAMGAAFGANLTMFRQGDRTFCGRTGGLTIPASLSGIIVGVFGLDKRPQARAQFRRSIRPAAAPAVTYTPPQVAAAYTFPSGLTGAGQTIAIIELGGGYTTTDLDAYFKQLGIATPSVTTVSVDGAKNEPTGDPNSADTEVMLDIEVTGAIAPGARIVVYFAPNSDQGFLDAITTAIHDTTNKPTIVSISWGGPESSWTAQAMTNYDAAFADAATLGVTICTASGDNGSSDGESDGLAHADFPSSSPNVLACGGTTLEASGSTISSETVWNDGTQGGATGGGVSDVFPLPAWQKSAGVPPSTNPGGRIGRGVPDVSGDADPNTGYEVRVDGASGPVGGTSAVAPLWAALVALINQHAGKPAGFINALLYASGETSFHDIVSGNNGAYAAKAKWDACTGLGSPNGTKVLSAIAPTR
jgi:kumamolisin